MAEKPRSKTPTKPTSRGGRPTKAEALRRRIEAVGVDPDAVDPRRVLAGIAIDPAASAAARVSACRVLLAHEARLAALVAAEAAEDEEPIPVDLVTERALQLMAAGRGGLQ